MKQLLIYASLFLCLSLSSCQCDSPPPVGPVDDASAAQLFLAE